MRSRLSPLAALLLTVLAMTAFALSFLNLQAALPQHEWRQALWQPDIDNIAQMLFHYSLLPRLAVSLLVGAGLGLVGVLFQQVLRNPLAEPTTLGVATGAQLGMTVTTLWAIRPSPTGRTSWGRPSSPPRWRGPVLSGRWFSASRGENGCRR